ncbi:plastocyanin/azurin family copper-binding protein [Halostella sp. PRR32]|uniref:plastocyanin/azurin family copper-binding protein n=1 Tax=Halostella sp. PRR32 TaxID=3098147 RepID=UPI002B1D1D63|nr:plastocyanin/azurin family copper-binding protein [Halostella sp. PRR32]
MSVDDANARLSRRGFLKAGAGATAAAGSAGVAAGQEDGNESDGNETAGGGGGGGGTETVELTGDNVFDPAELYIQPGTTVVFEWTSDGHNILVDDQPADANWEGHEPIENEGFTYEHTFEVMGEYAYFCKPHASLGMEATITVNESGQNPAASGGGGGPSLPDSALTMGIATMAAMLSTLGLAFFFLKYGGDYETPE